MAEDGEASDLSQLEEEFAVWKKNTPILYDLVISHPLEWPSLTVHWSPSPPQPYTDDPSFSVHGLLLGTHTSEGATNFLLVANAVLPDGSSSEGSGGESLSIPKVVHCSLSMRLFVFFFCIFWFGCAADPCGGLLSGFGLFDGNCYVNAIV